MSAASNESSPPPASHRLVAVWFADIVGYTDLSSRDERAALRLVRIANDAAREAIAHYHGELVKTTGDALLAAFGSTDDAVRAALRLTDEFEHRSAAMGTPARLRVGVHVGDVVRAADGDLHGDGVNRAARVQSIAEPGTVTVSEDVWRQLRQRPGFRFRTMGKRSLKGLPEAVLVFGVALSEPDHVSPVPLAGPRTGRWKGWAILAAGLAALALGAVAVWIALEMLSPEGGSGLDANLVAIAPFNVTISDPELQNWGEHLVDVLARNLDGAGPLRTVAPSSSINRWTGRADPASAMALGRRTGAGIVVFGNLIPSGQDSARVTASLLDVANGEIIDEVEVNVEDPARRMVQLSDQLTLALLRALGRTRPIGAVRTASLATATSTASLKAFLRGEQFFRRTTWDSATVYYARALEADSTFPLALRRMGESLGWLGASTDSLVLDYKLRAGAQNHGLTLRDSLLVLSDSLEAAAILASEDPAAGIARYPGLVRRLFATIDEGIARYPRDAEFWYAKGDAGYHFGFGFAAMAPEEILQAFDRSIELDTAHASAYLHPIELGFQVGGRERGMRYVRAFLALDPTGFHAEVVRLVARVSDPALANTPETERLLASSSRDALTSAFFLVDHWLDPAHSAVRLAERSAERTEAGAGWRATCDAALPRLAYRLAYRGRLREAGCALGPSPGSRKLFGALAYLGGIPEDSARRTFAAWLAPGDADAVAALPWWTDRRDSTSIARFVAASRARARSAAEPDDRVVASYNAEVGLGYLALARGDTAAALTRFGALSGSYCFECAVPLSLVHGRLLAATGRYREAESVLGGWQGPNMSPADVLMQLEHARVAERMGDLRAALTDYRSVADAWVRGDPSVHPFVAEARSAIGRLQRPEP